MIKAIGWTLIVLCWVCLIAMYSALAWLLWMLLVVCKGWIVLVCFSPLWGPLLFYALTKDPNDPDPSDYMDTM